MNEEKKVLIVDDDADILEVLQLLFESSGYITQVTTKGEETYQLVNKFKPDAIIMDVLLSGLDGRVICNTLKKATTTKKIPIIMISAHPDAHISTLQAGADDFMAKPFDIDQLVNKVEKYTN
jgi:DNA-binding response OmpR family regulator